MLSCNIGVSAKNCCWKEPVIFGECAGMRHDCLHPSLQAPAQGCGEGFSPAPAQCGLEDLTPSPHQKKEKEKNEKKDLGLNPAEIITSMKKRALRYPFGCC